MMTYIVIKFKRRSSGKQRNNNVGASLAELFVILEINNFYLLFVPALILRNFRNRFHGKRKNVCR